MAAPEYALSAPRNRTLVVGWGSADWAALHPHIDAGRMPALRALIEGGASAPLAGARPLTRETLWTSLATGLLADRHGVLAALEVRPDGGGVQPAGRRAWRAPAFWELLEAAGWRTACVDWPSTAPADRWPGTHIDADFATPSGDSFERWAVPPHSVAPPALAAALAELRVHPTDPLGPQVAALVPALAGIDQSRDGRVAALGTMLARAATVHAAATHIAAGPDWDVLIVHYDLFHAARLAFPPAATAGGPYGSVLAGVLALLDAMLARLLALAGPAATVWVASPNGIGHAPDGSVFGHARGILVAAGPGIAPDTMLPGADAVDLAPTLLARHGLAPPATDGRVLAALAPGPADSRRPAAWVRADTAGPAEQAAAAAQDDPADALLAEGYADALTDAQRRAVLEAERVAALHRGIALMSRGAPAEAAAAFEAVLASAPGDMLALRRLAQCRAMLGDYAACRALGHAMLAIDARQPWGHLALGTFLALGRKAGANDSRKAGAIDSRKAGAIDSREAGANDSGEAGAIDSREAAKAAEADEADATLARARALGASMPQVLVRLGGIALVRARAAEAAERFEEALRLDPERPDALYGLAHARALLGEAATAEQAYRRAIAVQHHQPLAHAELGALLAAQGRWREAAAALETALGQHPGLPETAALLAQARLASAGEAVAYAAAGPGGPAPSEAGRTRLRP